MKKRGELSSLLVTLITLVVALAVLVLVFVEFGEVLQEEATKKNCQWNLLVSARTKSPILGRETIPPDCKMTRKNITLEQLENKKKSNKKEIEKFNAKYEDSTYFNFNIDVDEELLEFEMDRIIANEIKDCWEVAWMGQMPIFQEWWSLIKCETNDEGDYKCDCVEGKECKFIPGLIEKVKFWNNDLNRPPAFCLLCSRIKFDDDLKETFKEKEITSLPEWMQKHPVLVDPQKRSYYEYTKDDVNRGIFAPDYVYNFDEPLAVVYSRVNVFKPLGYAERFLQWTGIKNPDKAHKPINVLSLMPYSEVSEKCTYIIG